jgi:glycosyltransferase involved in cell wall biosynthesis
MELALGTKVFTRVDDLRRLLDSVPEGVFNSIYVADDGNPSEKKNKIYEDYDINVIDLAYDAGLSAGRNAIVENATEECICIVDTDHRIPQNVEMLVDQLEVNSELGGVGGAIVEPRLNQIRLEAQDFAERRESRVLVRSPMIEDKEIQVVNGSPLVTFDFIPNAAVFRREVLREFPWDEEFTIEGEHLNYYLTHWKYSDWEFGINPSVCFIHYPGGDESHTASRESDLKERTSKQYLLDKWGYDQIDFDSYSWITITGERYGQMSTGQRVKRVVDEQGIPGFFMKVKKYIGRKYSEYRESVW